jgi:hypothetical protein
MSDLISRSDLLKWLDKETEMFDDDIDSMTSAELRCIIAHIQTMPSPKHNEPVADEPHVLTLAEAQGTDYVWFESRLTGCVFPASVSMSDDTWHGDYTTDVQQIGYGGYKFVLDKEYGSAWRCWSERPTELQRRAEPWEK